MRSYRFREVLCHEDKISIFYFDALLILSSLFTISAAAAKSHTRKALRPRESS